MEKQRVRSSLWVVVSLLLCSCGDTGSGITGSHSVTDASGDPAANCESYQRTVNGQALSGLSSAGGGTIENSQNFAQWVAVGDGLSIYTLANGASINESETRFIDDTRTEQSVAALRVAFGSEFQDQPSGGGSRTNAGYQRDVFDFQGCGVAQQNAERLIASVDNSRFAAETTWWLNWGWEANAAVIGSDGKYRLDGDKLYANISTQVRMPVWNAPTGTPASETTVWDNFSCALQAHENLHVETVRAVAVASLAEATTLQADTPAALYDDLGCLWAYGLQWGNREDVRIDAYTGHGPKL